MTEITFSRIIDAQPAKVWDALADLGAISNFHPFATDSYYDGQQLSGVGAARVCEFGPSTAVIERAVAWEEGKEYTLEIDFLRGQAPPIRDIRATLRVEPTSEGTRAVVEMSYTPKFGPVGAAMDHLMIRNKYGSMLEGMLHGLDHHLKTGETMDVPKLKQITAVPA